jgi:hypothetical protein
MFSHFILIVWKIYMFEEILIFYILKMFKNAKCNLNLTKPTHSLSIWFDSNFARKILQTSNQSKLNDFY